jgi:Family of unknown function (DUF6624)
MKQIFLTFLVITSFSNCYAQSGKTNFNYADFERQVIAYEPKQNDLSENDYNHGTMILTETKKAVKNNPANFNRAYYFNILSCFLSLKENIDNIKVAFEKFKNSEGSCDYFLSEGQFSSYKFDVIRNEIDMQIFVCNTLTPEGSSSFNLKGYIAENEYDYELVYLLDQIIELDKKYRSQETTDWSKQTPIDLENQRLVDSLFKAYGTYIGTSMVGKKYNYIMWIIIQHSNIEMMEKYLPIVQKAVEQEELGVVPFKMLIDRIYTFKHNYQIFGSQLGVEQANEKIRKEVITKYKLK